MFEDYQSVVGYPNLSENQTLNVVTDAFQYTYEISEVIFESWKSGTWNLALTGLTLFGICSQVARLKWHGKI
jgi:hypothetical protein